MSVAIYVKSESGDSYLYSFENTETAADIRAKMLDNIEMFEPIADCRVSIGKCTPANVQQEVDLIMDEIYDLSWSNR
jgi:hypothetical protein